MAKEIYTGSNVPSTKSYVVALLVIIVIAAGFAVLQNFQPAGYAATMNSVSPDKTVASQGGFIVFTSNGYSSTGRDVKITCNTKYQGKLTGLCQSSFIKRNPSCRWDVPADFAAGTYDAECFLRESTTYTRSASITTQITIASGSGGESKPQLTSFYAKPSPVSPGQIVTFISEGSSPTGRMVRLQCGLSSLSYNVCTGINLAQSNPTCYRLVPYTWSNTVKKVYCRIIDDAGVLSDEMSIDVTIKSNATNSTGPALTSLSAQPSTTQAGQPVKFTGAGSSIGRTVKLNCGLFNGSSNVCASYGDFAANPDCSVKVPNSWAGSAKTVKTVYCRITDSKNAVSNELAVKVTINPTASNTSTTGCGSLSTCQTKCGTGYSCAGATANGCGGTCELDSTKTAGCGYVSSCQTACGAGYSCVGIAGTGCGGTCELNTTTDSPVLQTLTPEPSVIKAGQNTTLTGTGSWPDRKVKLRCGLYSGGKNVCESPAFVEAEPSCQKKAPTTWVGMTKKIYCKVFDDSGSVSDELIAEVSVT